MLIEREGSIPSRGSIEKLENSVISHPLEKKNSDYYDDPLDVLLATNMMSVGVDVPRLGAMIVNGQPKNNSEYIQATGRIGRNNPGLIVTLYSYTKPRDISYYENFRDYHSTFYKNVETVSLTPFTVQSRDSGLFAIFVGLIRMSTECPSLVDDKNAYQFDLKIREQDNFIHKIRDIIKNRVDSIEPDESLKTLEHLDKLQNYWSRLKKIYSNSLRYREPYHENLPESQVEKYKYLLKTDMASTRQFITAPISLRNAEQEQKLRYIDELTQFESDDKNEIGDITNE